MGWLKGCEICNTGLVTKVDEYVKQGLSVRKAAALMAKEGERKIGDLVYSAAAIRARYRFHKGLREPHPAQESPKSDLEKAAGVIKKAARLLERIVEGDLKDNGTDEDKLFVETIKKHGPSIIISYYKLDRDSE